MWLGRPYLDHASVSFQNGRKMGNSLQSGSEAQGLDYSQGSGLPGGCEKSSHVQKLQRLRASAAVTACDLLDAVSLEEKESGPPTPRARAGLTHSSFQHAEQCNLCRRNREARPEELTPGRLPQELSRYPGLFFFIFVFKHVLQFHSHSDGDPLAHGAGEEEANRKSSSRQVPPRRDGQRPGAAPWVRPARSSAENE